MLAREIKDLSFALEALARVADASRQYEDVKYLLSKKIDALRSQMADFVMPPPPPVGLDDDIPF